MLKRTKHVREIAQCVDSFCIIHDEVHCDRGARRQSVVSHPTHEIRRYGAQCYSRPPSPNQARGAREFFGEEGRVQFGRIGIEMFLFICDAILAKPKQLFRSIVGRRTQPIVPKMFTKALIRVFTPKVNRNRRQDNELLP
ncbi:hypothetical protein QR680_002254 [Steinernema hermaphroditum]|uniref:Uncharacterized protein n=1 Tax=Steinernema hermaphroditum TaxID=289476 RepID=A0AA39H2U7_9BILA|nr:hypothetical protein QR680_002254 [Steinernema hermaphroditum]